MSNESRIQDEIERRKADLRANFKPPATIEVWPSDRALSEISFVFGGLSLIGAGAPNVTDSKLIMWGFIAVGFFGIAAVIALRIIRFLRMRQRRPPVSIILRTWRWTLTSLIIVALAIGSASYFQTRMHFGAAPPASQWNLKSLFDLFKSDFANLFQIDVETTANAVGSSDVSKINTKACLDFAAKTWFGAFFLPKGNDSYIIAIQLANDYLRLLEDVKKKTYMATKDPGDSERTEIGELTFSGRIYLYHEDNFTLKQMSDLTELFKARGAALQLRGTQYQISRAIQDQHK